MILPPIFFKFRVKLRRSHYVKLLAIATLGLFTLSTYSDDKLTDKSPLFTSAESLGSQVPENFNGALFVCAPYCELLSVRNDGIWKPDLSSVMVFSKNVMLLDRSDPLFASLMGDSAPSDTDPGLASSEVVSSAKSKQSENPDAAVAERKSQRIRHRWRAGAGIEYLQMTSNSNGNLQTDLKPGSQPLILSLDVGYKLGTPLLFLTKRWQFEVDYTQDVYGTKVSLPTGASMDIKKYRLSGIVWVKEKHFSWGLRLSLFNEAVGVSQNTLQAFSFNEQSVLIGPVFQYRRLQVGLDYGVGYKLEEKQPVRDQLKSDRVYGLNAMYCLRPTGLFGYAATWCFQGHYLQVHNSATLLPAYSTTAVSDFSRRELSGTVKLFFGSDFMQ